jgi:hypothetical protein
MVSVGEGTGVGVNVGGIDVRVEVNDGIAGVKVAGIEEPEQLINTSDNSIHRGRRLDIA